MYPVNEIFATLQGEATFTGTPSIFIRIQGCKVGCPWCDTKHTWELDTKDETDFTLLVAKTNDKNSWSNASVEQIVDFIKEAYPKINHVVITGGEPTMYDLVPLSLALENLGKDIQIETSGTEIFRITKDTWVSLSPKIDMPGGKVVIPQCVVRANEIKMPIGKISDIEKLKKFIKEYEVNQDIPIWLQPLSQNPSSTKLCIEETLLNNWRLSLQTHKFINIR